MSPWDYKLIFEYFVSIIDILIILVLLLIPSIFKSNLNSPKIIYILLYW